MKLSSILDLDLLMQNNRPVGHAYTYRHAHLEMSLIEHVLALQTVTAN